MSTGGGAHPPHLPAGFSARHGDLEVRDAVPGDFDQLDQLLGLLVDPSERRPAGREAFLRILADDRRAVLVAARGTRLVGTLDLIVIDNVTHGGAPWAAVENVVVDSSERRTGIASALMQSAFSLAIGAGCYKLQLLSGARRADAHGLYESVGMDAPVRGFRRYF